MIPYIRVFLSIVGTFLCFYLMNLTTSMPLWFGLPSLIYLACIVTFCGYHTFTGCVECFSRGITDRAQCYLCFFALCLFCLLCDGLIFGATLRVFYSSLPLGLFCLLAPICVIFSILSAVITYFVLTSLEEWISIWEEQNDTSK